MAFSPLLLRLFLNYKCFYECDHCFMYGSPNASGEMSSEDAKSYIKAGKEHGISMVSFTGGDPFMFPQKLAELVEYSAGLDLRVMVESAFIGTTEEEMRKNAKMLAKFDVTFPTSINVFQKWSSPPGFDYIANKTLMLQILMEEDVNTGVTAIDVPQYKETSDIFEQIWERLETDLLEQPIPFTSYSYMMVKDGFRVIGLGFNPLMRVGRAYDKNLVPEDDWIEALKKDGGIVSCTQFATTYEGEPMGVPQILVHPSGLVHICCQHQKGVDFGFGNLKEDGWRRVMDNIENHPLINEAYDPKLNRIKSIIETEYPGYVPKKGFTDGCEVCNLYHRNKQVKQAVDKKLASLY